MDSASLNKPRTRTVLASIRWDGTIVPATYEGGTTGDRFASYINDTLIPTLNPGDIVVMDHMRSHHVAAVEDALTKAGFKGLYLPAYSPYLNPIEMLW